MLPDSVKKRDLLGAVHKTPPDFSAYGEEFLREGHLADAAEFFARAKNQAKLKEILGIALREGDAGLVGRVCAWAPDLVTADTWRECALEALRLEKFSFARQAWEKAGDPAKAAEAHERVLRILGYTPMKAATDETSTSGNTQFA